MEDSLSIIDRIIEWHKTIRQHVKLVGDSISDREAVTALQETHPGLIPGRLEILSENYKKIQQAVALLDEGLGNHFDYEEKSLPPVLGDLFMRALLLDHEEIRREIGKAKSTLAGIRLEGMSREELLADEKQLRQLIEGMLELVREHAAREEIILEMARKALLEEKKGS